MPSAQGRLWPKRVQTRVSGIRRQLGVRQVPRGGQQQRYTRHVRIVYWPRQPKEWRVAHDRNSKQRPLNPFRIRPNPFRAVCTAPPTCGERRQAPPLAQLTEYVEVSENRHAQPALASGMSSSPLAGIVLIQHPRRCPLKCRVPLSVSRSSLWW